MDKTSGGVQYEQAVINETEKGPELDPDRRIIRRYQLCVFAFSQQFSEPLEGKRGISRNLERCDVMVASGLTGDAIGFCGAHRKGWDRSGLHV